MIGSRPRVVIVHRWVPHYRVPFFEQLRQDLADRGVDFELVRGLPTADYLEKPEQVDLPWAITVANRWIGVGSRRLLWQPAMPHLRRADLVIVEQASSRILNYLLFLRQLTGRTRLAFWGHGRNFKEARVSRVGELVKRFMSRHVHWWFAYNRVAVEVIEDLGYPPERITDVQNAIDTGALREVRRGLTASELADVRAELGLPARHVGVYVGKMYPEKRVAFVLDAALRVREHVGDFALILIGGGPDEELARRAAAEHPWIHYLGPVLGTEKVRYLAVAEVLLMPGLVGLVILDSFALEVPMITTADAIHSPEIDYLEDGRNGVLLGVGTTPERYAAEVTRVLEDDQILATLRAGCRESAARYTVEEMSRRFAEGILGALDARPRR